MWCSVLVRVEKARYSRKNSISLISTDKRVKLSTITEKMISLQTSVIFLLLEEFCRLNYHCEVSFLWGAASIRVSVLRRSRGTASNLRRSVWSQQRNSPAGPARPPLCSSAPQSLQLLDPARGHDEWFIVSKKSWLIGAFQLRTFKAGGRLMPCLLTIYPLTLLLNMQKKEKHYWNVLSWSRKGLFVSVHGAACLFLIVLSNLLHHVIISNCEKGHLIFNLS